MTVTTRRDRFPSGLKSYFHHAKELATKLITKVIRYENPIVAIKQVKATGDEKAYTKTHVSFQSTGATNISGVNNLPSCGLYVTAKSRGQGSHKRTWGIEQNEGRHTYLSTYFGLDNVDHIISMAMIRYITWKYWHSPFLHGYSMAVIAAYDMYQECCEGGLCADWFVPIKERMTFRTYRLRLSEQMLTYDPKKGLYPGDEKFRSWTKEYKRKRGRDTHVCDDGLTVSSFKRAKLETRTCTPRLCGDLDALCKHSQSMYKLTCKGMCQVCGKKTVFKCGICDKRLCLFEKKKWSAKCFHAYHNDNFFGLAKGDASMHGSTKNYWRVPTGQMINRNGRRIAEIKNNIEEEQL